MLVLGKESRSFGLKENLPTSPLTLGSAVSTAGPEKQSPRERNQHRNMLSQAPRISNRGGKVRETEGEVRLGCSLHKRFSR